ncbi:unnamed protein product [Mycena citricolor]|uniref:BHLH domain-containing protein n=1 Tax=Mycena citricolor TaxID=2018698 RepID=A0AAD2JXP1_9AGAR|nr:unnamed protein product [Mycena citricolor]
MATAFMYKPQHPHIPVVRQEGFHLPGAHSNPTPPPHNHHHHSSDSAAHQSGGLGFGGAAFHGLEDELASLMHPRRAAGDRSAHSPANGDDRPPSGVGYRPPPHTHNIFDISAPPMHHHSHHAGSASSTSSAFPSHFSRGSHSPPSTFTEGPISHHYNFNSTLPALNSSMRYDPHPPTPTSHNFAPSPSSFRSPSPRDSHSRSRSRSRPLTTGSSGPGPTRNSRSRRTGSFTSGSPPPHHRPVPHAIVIPGAATPRPASSSSYSWFSGSDYPSPADSASLPSLTSLPSLPSLASSLQSPHSPYLAGAQFSSPVETKFGMNLHGINNMSLGVGTSGGHREEPKEESMESKAAQIANEKRRRRRESHNAVERRRRDNINERISELATLIPECMLEINTKKPGDDDSKDADASTKSGSASPGGNNHGTTTGKDGVVKANKGMILRKSVDYIRCVVLFRPCCPGFPCTVRYLQQLVTAQGARNRELEEQLKGFRGVPPHGSDGNSSEMVLGDFGSSFDVNMSWQNSLTSMPEGDDEDADSDGPDMQIDEDRGRKSTRTNGRKKSGGALPADDDDLSGEVSETEM